MLHLSWCNCRQLSHSDINTIRFRPACLHNLSTLKEIIFQTFDPCTVSECLSVIFCSRYTGISQQQMAKPILILHRHFSSSPSTMSAAINHVTVIGGGLMGSGIAQVAAQSGHQVTLVEVNEAALQKAQSSIVVNLKRVSKKIHKDNPDEAEKFVSNAIKHLKTTLNVMEAVKNTDLVIEAIVENLEIKHKLFATIDSVAPEHTIFASNTSSLSIQDIASVVNRKDRFGGLHFFNPVQVMKLLEVIRIPETSDETYEKMMAWGKAIGKTTITCKDTPGFVVNRLLRPYLNEALRLLENGVATVEDIDTAMKLGAGYPMGPFEVMDYVGLDTKKFTEDALYKRYPDNPLYKPSSLLSKMVAEGKLGVKSGEGFYKYNKGSKL